MSLSVLILAKNEEKNILECIESVKFADQIVVIDDFSTDNTVKLAREAGALVVQHAMNGNWGAQQNFALQQAEMDWVFFLDADERVTPELRAEIHAAMQKRDSIAYSIPRKNYVMNEPLLHGGWYPDRVLRLFPGKDFGVEGYVHPHYVHSYKIKKMKAPLIHYTYVSWEQYFNKNNNYSTLAARKNADNNKRTYFFRDIILRPIFSFVKKYIIQLGFLDGRLGFVMAILYSQYTMSKYLKLYYLYKARESA